LFHQVTPHEPHLAEAPGRFVIARELPRQRSRDATDQPQTPA
jgi:hypothetical protein